MPLFRLSSRLEFPPANLARSDGLLCIGGDLSTKRLLLAYKNGIFPWFSDEEPILWWSPNPRLILFPNQIHISKSLKKTIRKQRFTIKVNTAFEQTIMSCSKPRQENQAGTWLVEEMISAYIRLHEKGHAHSIEAWEGSSLVGGLYGICIGGSFFGESMFSHKADASKLSLVALARYLYSKNFDLIDCQVTTDHLLSMGATQIQRDLFLKIIGQSVKRKDMIVNWDSGKELSLF